MTHQHSTHIQPKWWLASVICILGALFYLYEFVLQVAPSVMTGELMRDFAINSAGLGAMAAFYYYAYTPMQLPAGILYDRYGPRRILTIAVLICSLGALFFSMTTSIFLASWGRFLIGMGSAFSFIGALVLVSRWFPARYFALLAGLVQLMSSIGAITGEAPLAAAIAKYGWRSCMLTIAMIGFLLALSIWLVVRDRPKWEIAQPGHELKHEELGMWQGLKKVLSHSQTWFIAIYSFCVWAPIVVFAALWGVPFLTQLFGISIESASAAMSLVWIAIGIGSPLIGWWSDRIGRRCLPLTISAIIGIVSTFCILYLPHISMSFMYLMLFGLGIAASGQSLSFGLVKDINHVNVVGTAIGFNNMAVVAGGALINPLVGFLLNIFWSGEVIDGVPIYTITAYRYAMFLLPICFVVALIVSVFFLRETNCQYVFTSDKAKDQNQKEEQNCEKIMSATELS